MTDSRPPAATESPEPTPAGVPGPPEPSRAVLEPRGAPTTEGGGGLGPEERAEYEATEIRLREHLDDDEALTAVQMLTGWGWRPPGAVAFLLSQARADGERAERDRLAGEVRALADESFNALPTDPFRGWRSAERLRSLADEWARRGSS